MNKLNIVFLCIFCGNPYADLLVKPLEHREVNLKIEEKSFNFIFLPRIIAEGKPDIVHLHTLHYFFLGRNQLNRSIKFFIFIIQILVLKLIGVKVIWTVHEWKNRFDNSNNDIPQGWASIIGRIFDAIITHSKTTQNEISEACSLKNNNKVFVVPHGNYIGCYENIINQLMARKALSLPTENLVFLLFGNLHKTKGFLEAIEAFKGLQDIRISLLIVGNPAENQVEELIRERIQGYENILFVPKRVQDDEIQIYMNACDCVVLPYKVFTTSGTAILAMSFGRSCIAPNTGYFSDVLDDSGAFLYDANNEDGLLYAMKQAIEKRDKLLDMGKHNLKLAEQWNWDYVADETIKIYQGCLTS
jgi:glycosyltransferase involved in cell wall biosynthesis